MRGQPSSLKPRKRKSNCEVRNSRKVCVSDVCFFWILNVLNCGWRSTLCGQVCATGKRCVRSPKRHTSGERGDGKADDGLERRSHITCECHQASRTRCSASPEPRGPEGKENELRLELDLHGCEANDTSDKQEPEDMDCEEIGRSIFPDDDSNQILPVEQFFGNLDTVQVRLFGSFIHFCALNETVFLCLWWLNSKCLILQDFPQRSSAASAHHQRHGRRRRYYAPEDSDEEEAVHGSSQRDHAGS